MHSPRIDKIDLVKSGKVRHAKLVFKKTFGKAARLVDREQDSQTTAHAETASAPASPAESV